MSSVSAPSVGTKRPPAHREEPPTEKSRAVEESAPTTSEDTHKALIKKLGAAERDYNETLKKIKLVSEKRQAVKARLKSTKKKIQEEKTKIPDLERDYTMIQLRSDQVQALKIQALKTPGASGTQTLETLTALKSPPAKRQDEQLDQALKAASAALLACTEKIEKLQEGSANLTDAKEDLIQQKQNLVEQLASENRHIEALKKQIQEAEGTTVSALAKRVVVVENRDTQHKKIQEEQESTISALAERVVILEKQVIQLKTEQRAVHALYDSALSLGLHGRQKGSAMEIMLKNFIAAQKKK